MSNNKNYFQTKQQKNILCMRKNNNKTLKLIDTIKLWQLLQFTWEEDLLKKNIHNYYIGSIT